MAVAAVEFRRHDKMPGQCRDSIVPLFARASRSSSISSLPSDELPYLASQADRSLSAGDPLTDAKAKPSGNEETDEEGVLEGVRRLQRQRSKILYHRRVAGQSRPAETNDAPEADTNPVPTTSNVKSLKCGRSAKVLFDWQDPRLHQPNTSNCNGHQVDDLSEDAQGEEAGRRLKRNASKVLYRRSPLEEVVFNPAAIILGSSSSSPDSELKRDEGNSSAQSTVCDTTPAPAKQCQGGGEEENRRPGSEMATTAKERPPQESPEPQQNAAKVLFSAPLFEKTDYYV